MQYLFEGGNEVPVVIPPHGNAKTNTSSYCRTQKSTIAKIKNSSGKPKSIVSSVFEEAGGSLNASSASELPRNRRQVYNSKRFPSSGNCCSTSSKSDPIFELIKQCKEDLLPGGRKFVRSVNIESSPSK